MTPPPCSACGLDPTLPGHAFACEQARRSPSWRAYLAAWSAPDAVASRQAHDPARSLPACRHRRTYGCCGDRHTHCDLRRDDVTEADCLACTDAVP